MTKTKDEVLNHIYNQLVEFLREGEFDFWDTISMLEDICKEIEEVLGLEPWEDEAEDAQD